MGLGADSNHLKHFENGLLTIKSGSSATLSAPTFSMVHSVSGETVSAPELQNGTEISLSYSSTAGGRVLFKATDAASHLELQGFFTADKGQLYLLLSDSQGAEDFLGLVLATRVP
jgi:hypothetical protein